MGTQYYCDACKEETHNQKDLQPITRDRGKRGIWMFDLCDKCATKIFKPVKEIRTTLAVELKEVDNE